MFLAHSQIPEARRDADVVPQPLHRRDRTLGGAALVQPRNVLAEEAQPAAQAIQAVRAVTTRLLARSAIACLIVGFAALNVADAGWAHAIGVVCLLAFVALGFRALILPALGEEAATR